jgi:hypothetical protein
MVIAESVKYVRRTVVAMVERRRVLKANSTGWYGWPCDNQMNPGRESSRSIISTNAVPYRTVKAYNSIAVITCQ